MRFSARELGAIADLLREAGLREIMPRFRRLGAEAVRQKTGPLDLVTDADEAAEAFVAGALQRLYPGCVVVGEEATARDRSLLARIADADLAFVLDPVDGTSNYAAGVPLFGTMLAAIVRGEVVASAIHDPVCNDTALALRGEGAWMDTAGTRTDLRVAAPVPVGRMTGSASWRFLPEPARSRVCAGQVRLAQLWDFRCAAHEYRMLAAGHCHFLLFNRLMPWDHAPGWLLHREAGGFAARFDGSAYTPCEHTGGLLCTPDEASWHELHAALLGDCWQR